MGSLDELFKVMDGFLEMKDNWDSYGASAPTLGGVERGKSLARVIYGKTRLIPEGAAPQKDGKGVVFEWFPWTDRECVIIDIDGEGECGLLLPNEVEYEGISADEVCGHINEYKGENGL